MNKLKYQSTLQQFPLGQATLNLEPINPPKWLIKGHGQTLVGHFIPTKEKLNEAEKHFVELPDGDQLVLDIKRGTKPIVFAQYHGLSGDMNADYMIRGALIASELGYTSVRVNHRDAGPGKGLAIHPYHSGRAEDISAVTTYLREIFPGHKQLAAGYSMSGNILLYLLSGQRGNEKPDGAICVNAPINLRNCSLNMNKGFSSLYGRRFAFKLRQMVHQKKIDFKIPITTSLWEFDQLYTAPAGGFKNREDYYQTCSSEQYLHLITSPTYVLTSLDDPIINVEDYLKAKWSNSTHLTISKYGGHLGYYSKTSPVIKNGRWLDHYIRTTLMALELK